MNRNSLKFKCMNKVPEIDDPDLVYLTRLIYHPLTGPLYRYRFQMLLDLCDTPVDRVLEIGYGAGFLTYVLAQKSREYFAVDIHADYKKVEQTLKKLGIHNVLCKKMDARYLVEFPDNSFGLVASISCLEHIREQDVVQKEIHRVLKPQGHAIYGLPIKNIITKAFLRVIGYDDRIIHPSSPLDVLNSARKAGLTLDRQKIFPPGMGRHLGLYWVGRFIKTEVEKT